MLQNRITEAHAQAGTYFYTVAHSTNPDIADFIKAEGIPISSDVGEGVLCDDDGGWVLDAARLWGYSSGIELLCDMGAKRANGSHCLATDQGSGEFQGDHAAVVSTGNIITGSNVSGDVLNLKTFQTNIKNRVYGGKDPTYSDAANYVLARDAFFTGCLELGSGSASNVPDAYVTSAPDDKFTFNGVKIVDPTTGTVTGNGDGLKLYGKKKTTDSVSYYMGLDSGNKSSTCQGLVDQINKYAGAYSIWVIANPNTPDQTGSTKCQSSTDPGCGSTTSQTTCNISGVGWILCPVLTAGAGLADDAYHFLEDKFLVFNTALVNTDPNATTAVTSTDSSGNTTTTQQPVGTGAYQAWGIMRNFANVAFVIVFLIIMFSQLTGVGISSYGVKKLLPRLIIGAVLVNVSFYICQLAVDLSNLLGFGLKSLMSGIADQVKATGGGAAVSTADQSNNLAGITSLVIGAAVLAWINVGALIVAMVSAVVALLTIFVILIVREVVIILLIVISPLAFVAYLLPNTEPLFKRWRKTLTSMLMLFPIIGLIYGGGLLASAILLQVAGTDTPLKIAAYAALVVPLLAVIPLTKGALSAIPVLGSAIQNFGNKAKGASGGFAKNRFDQSRFGQFKKYRSSRFATNRSLAQSGAYTGWNPLRKAQSGANSLINKSGMLGKFGASSAAAGKAMVQEQEAKEIKEATVPLEQELAQAQLGTHPKFTGPSAQDDLLRDRARTGRTSAERRAAMHKAAALGRDDVLRDLQADPSVDQGHLRAAISDNAGTLLVRAPDLVKGEAGAFGSVTGQQLSTFSKGTAQAYIKYLAGLHATATTPLPAGATPEQTRAQSAAAAALPSAAQSFNAAVEDIHADPTKQGVFDGNTGKAIQTAVADLGTSAPATQAYLDFHMRGSATAPAGLDRINADGKIR